MPAFPIRGGMRTSEHLYPVCAAGCLPNRLVSDREWGGMAAASRIARPLVVSLPAETAVIDSTSLLELLNKLIWLEKVQWMCITFTELVLVQDYSTLLGFIAVELQIFPTVDRVVSIYQFIWEILKSLGKVCNWYTLRNHCVLPLWFTVGGAFAWDNPNAL